MVFQILVGIWMFISPFVLGYGEETMGQSMMANNMIFGAVVALLGLGISLFNEEVCAGVEDAEKRTV
jgi:hypothetical protein